MILLKLLLSTLMLFLTAVLSVALVLGFGTILHRMFPLDLFQVSLLLAIAVLTGVIGRGFDLIRRAIQRQGLYDDDDDEDEWEVEDEEEDSIESTDISEEHPVSGLRREDQSRVPQVGRNHPCPCGSGKKYKLCCLRQEESWDQDVVRF